MDRRLALRLSGITVFTLFYPASDAPPFNRKKFVEKIVEANRRLRRQLAKNGWPIPAEYPGADGMGFMGEDVDFARLHIGKQYGELYVLTSVGKRTIRVLMMGHEYRIVGIFSDGSAPLSASSQFPMSSQLRAKNVAWSVVQRELRVI